MLQLLGYLCCKDLAVTSGGSDARCLPENNVVVVFGSTGTGKTKLSVQIAHALSQADDSERFAGYKTAEVISCDSMQIYRGLDIITNKATEKEMAGIPHHLMGFLSPGQEYDITQFVADSDAIGERLSSNRTLPIVCGGTTYYLQHLLFPGRLISTRNTRLPESSKSNNDAILQRLTPEERHLLSNVGSKSHDKQRVAAEAASEPSHAIQLWTLLNKIDPDMATRWHWKDVRKTSNSLRVFGETGQRHSDWIKQQDMAAPKQAAAVTPLSDGHVNNQKIAKYRKLLFWVWCEPEVLKSRLDDRVNEMVERGLIDEIREMQQIARQILHNVAGAERTTYQNGIFQTIGYKQFDEYLQHLAELTEPDQPFKADAIALNKAVNDTKVATRQYAKSQVKWITNKLMPEVRKVQQACGHSNDAQVYLLDTTDPTAWDQNVAQPAIDIVRKFLRGEMLPDPTSISAAARDHLLQTRSENQALRKLASLSPASSEPPNDSPAEGTRTIQANAWYTCHVCTHDDKTPYFVRVVDRAIHETGRVHRNNVVKKTSPSEREAEIEKKIKAGLQKKADRERTRVEARAIKAAVVSDKA